MASEVVPGDTPMLVLSRKRNESIVIDEAIVVTVVEIRGDKIRLGIQAPREMSIHRAEVYQAIRRMSAPPHIEPGAEEMFFG